jgi:hypothetical protein
MFVLKHKLMEDTPGAGDGAGAANAAAATAATDTATTAQSQTTTQAQTTTATNTPDKPVVQKWPDNWRTEIAGTDEKALKQLERYATPADIWKKASELEKKLSSGQVRSVLPKDATPEQVKAWRAENGLPESPDKYDLSGIEITEADKPIVDEFLKAAHEANLSPDQAKAAIQWNRQHMQKMIEARTEQDRTLAMSTIDTLRSEWGQDFRVNMSVIGSMLDGAGEGMKDKILQARMPDGTPIGSSPEALKMFVSLAREINPMPTIVPPAGANISGAIDDEISKFNSMMGDKSSAYWKGPDAEKHQARYRELIAAKEKLKGRAA